MSLQWMKEDFDCVGFAYNAVPPGFHALLAPTTTGTTAPSDIIIMGGEGDNAQDSTSSSPHENPGERLMAVASMLVRGETVFTGVVGSRQQPRPEVAGLVEDLRRAGVRFVYFSSREARRTRIAADKMGLETDWNTSISLQAAETKRGGKSGGGGGGRRRRTRRPSGRGRPKCRAASRPVRAHVETVDDVPLRVSVFTDATPESAAAMLDVLRDYRDVVLSVGTALSGGALRGVLASDIAVGLLSEGAGEADAWMAASERLGELGCSFSVRGRRDAVMDLLTAGRVCLFNYQQWHHAFIALCYLAASVDALAACLTCPAPLTVAHSIFLVWVQVPLMCVPVALRRRTRKVGAEGEDALEGLRPPP